MDSCSDEVNRVLKMEILILLFLTANIHATHHQHHPNTGNLSWYFNTSRSSTLRNWVHAQRQHQNSNTISTISQWGQLGDRSDTVKMHHWFYAGQLHDAIHACMHVCSGVVWRARPFTPGEGSAISSSEECSTINRITTGFCRILATDVEHCLCCCINCESTLVCLSLW